MQILERILDFARPSHPHSVEAVRLYLMGGAAALGQQLLTKWRSNPEKYQTELVEFTLAGARLNEAGLEVALQEVLNKEINTVMSCCLNAHMHGGYVTVRFPTAKEREALITRNNLPATVFVARLEVVLPKDGVLPTPPDLANLGTPEKAAANSGSCDDLPAAFTRCRFDQVHTLSRIARGRPVDGPVTPDFSWISDPKELAKILGN